MAENTNKGSQQTPAPSVEKGADNTAADLSIAPTIKPETSTPAPAKPADNAASTPSTTPPAPAPKPTETAKPAAPVPAPTPAPAPKKEGGISFSNIFNNQKSKKQDTKVLTGILKKKDTSPTKMKPILGDAPVLQKTIAEERNIKLKKQLRLVQSVFVIVFLAAVGSAFYFYSELSPTFDLFGPNTTQRLRDVNENLRGVQTQLNKYRYLAAQLDLNRFSFISSDFLDKTAQLADGGTGQVALSNTVSEAAQSLPILLSNVRTQLSPNIVVETTRSLAEEEQTPQQIQKQAEDDLRNALLADRREITQNAELTTANEQDLKLIDNTVKLVGNSRLLTTVRNASADQFAADLTEYVSTLESESRKQLTGFMSSVLSSTKSDIATISTIKANKIDWTGIMGGIENVTRTVDPTFGAGLAQSLGDGIFYTGYSFDTSNNKILLSGVTKTTTADNFTLISELIESLELSTDFMDVDMRSFSKAGTFADGFTSNFKIDLLLETDDATEENAPVALEPKTVAAATGVQRSQ